MVRSTYSQSKGEENCPRWAAEYFADLSRNRLKQPNRRIPNPRKKKLEQDAKYKPVDHPNKPNKFLREWQMKQVPEYKNLTTSLSRRLTIMDSQNIIEGI